MGQKALIYGAGVIGSVYAHRFAEAGLAVSVLARGERLAALRSKGLLLRHAMLGTEERSDIRIIERLQPGSVYDLVIVALRSGQIENALADIRASNVKGPVLVIGNNLGDLDAQAETVGKERFILGFGAFGGYREGGTVVYLDGRTKEKPGKEGAIRTTAGILGQEARPAFESMRRTFALAGLGVEESADMPAWLLCHAALVFPLAGAIYAAAGNQLRFCRTRDAIILGVRACKEAMGALRSLGWRVEPKSLKSLIAMPEWILVPLLAKRFKGEGARVAMFGHAVAPGGRSEVCGQASVLDGIIGKTGKRLPYWDRLMPFFAKTAEPLPDGSRKLRLRLR